MLIDDSAVVRGFITRILEADPDISVIYSAQNGEVGVNALDRQRPDIILLDVEMPVMDGITAIPHILKKIPDVKIIMCSTLTTQNAAITIKAMGLGAVDCIGKPTSTNDIQNQAHFRETLLHKIKSIAEGSPSIQARLRNLPISQSAPTTSSTTTAKPTSLLSPKTALQLRPAHEGYAGKPDIIAIGSSTGGPNAIMAVIKHFVGFDVPIVLTQHMPATFTKILADNIKLQTGVDCIEAADKMPLMNGRVHVAAGGFHMVIDRDGFQKIIRLNDGPMENFCKPAVDPMLRSLIPIYGEKILTVILTGMGADGLLGAKDITTRGGRVYAQDEATSVVWGMPGAVAKAGICSAILPLDDIGPAVRKAMLK
jgi:two-component system chemotaxis response regulator CheB